MKKFLAVILAAITLMLCLCSCNKLETGFYQAEENPETGAQPIVVLLKDGRANFTLNQLTHGFSRSTYTVDEENDLVTVTIKKTGDNFVFLHEKDSLVFVADKSDAPEEYNGQPGMKDGEIFTLLK